MPYAGDVIVKDPNAVLPYTMDWSGWLATGVTISTSTWTVESGSGLTASGPSNTTTTATVTLSGGTAGLTRWSVTNRITTSASQTEDRSFYVVVQER